MYDVPFCPEVAYSIPLSPTISQSDALDVIKQTISPNYANFSNTVDTFPCGDPEFGMYSYVATCEDCKNSYRNWLCAVAMPRCTDPISSTFQSAASQNGSDLTGADTPPNTAALPYIVNRNNDSRQTYIDQDLQPGAYGELLPCTSTCYFVSRACPPVVQWGCPQWDITAQRDYGAFVDADSDGNGGGANGGAGPLGQRWGGVQRFVATDGFGNQYCNALGTDLALRQQNAAPSVRGSPGTLMVWIMPFVAALAVALS